MGTMKMVTLYLTLLLVGSGLTHTTSTTAPFSTQTPPESTGEAGTPTPTITYDTTSLPITIWSCITGWFTKTTGSSPLSTETPYTSPYTTSELYQCQESFLMVPSLWVCDGIKNCPFGDDELDCPTETTVTDGEPLSTQLLGTRSILPSFLMRLSTSSSTASSMLFTTS